jgi:hypothetical protein
MKEYKILEFKLFFVNQIKKRKKYCKKNMLVLYARYFVNKYTNFFS